MSTHILPAADLNEHQTSRHCPCQPELELTTRDDGTKVWAVTHRPIQPQPRR